MPLHSARNAGSFQDRIAKVRLRLIADRVTIADVVKTMGATRPVNAEVR